ncbi:MAG: hypothetical protein WBX15_06320 [Thermoanaerobaculia bacterium]
MKNQSKWILAAAMMAGVLAIVTPAHAKSLQGDVAVATHGGRAFIGVDTGRADHAGLVDYGFVFVSGMPGPAVSLILKNAHVEYDSEYVRVISATTRQIFSFSVAGQPDVNRTWPAGFSVTQAEGYQLSWYDVTTRSITLTDVLMAFSPQTENPQIGSIQPLSATPYYQDPFGADSDSASCRSGGKGSTECTVEWDVAGGSVTYHRSCTVKCAAGYYACCNDYSCTCVANTGGGW